MFGICKSGMESGVCLEIGMGWSQRDCFRTCKMIGIKEVLSGFLHYFPLFYLMFAYLLM